jgi:hypothetical protein
VEEVLPMVQCDELHSFIIVYCTLNE